MIADLQALPSDYEEETDLPNFRSDKKADSGQSDDRTTSSSSSDNDSDLDTEDIPQEASGNSGSEQTMADVIKDIVAMGKRQK